MWKAAWFRYGHSTYRLCAAGKRNRMQSERDSMHTHTYTRKIRERAITFSFSCICWLFNQSISECVRCVCAIVFGCRTDFYHFFFVFFFFFFIVLCVARALPIKHTHRIQNGPKSSALVQCKFVYSWMRANVSINCVRVCSSCPFTIFTIQIHIWFSFSCNPHSVKNLFFLLTTNLFVCFFLCS